MSISHKKLKIARIRDQKHQNQGHCYVIMFTKGSLMTSQCLPRKHSWRERCLFNYMGVLRFTLNIHWYYVNFVFMSIFF